MRVLSNNDHEKVADRIIEIGKKYGVNTPDILFDLYNALVSKGVSIDPDPDVLKALKKKDPNRYWVERDAYHKQVVIFDTVKNSPLFQAYLTLAPLDAIEKVCEQLKDAWTRQQAAASAAVPVGAAHPLSTTAEIDKELMRAAQAVGRQVGAAVSSGGLRQFDIGCPDTLMEALFGAFNQPAAIAGMCLTQMGGMPYCMITSGNPTRKEAKWIIQAASEFCKKGGVSFFKWISNVAGKAGFEKKSKKRTEEITKDKTADQMNDVQELVTANPADLQRPDVDKKITQKQIDVEKSTAESVDKAHCFTLLDVSGSMACNDCAGGRIDRAMYGLVVVVAMLHQVISRGDEFHLMLFEGRPHPTLHATDQKSAVEMIERLMKLRSTGASTHIQGALDKACREVAQINKYRHADIVLITDGEDLVNIQETRKKLPPNTKLRGIHIGDSIMPENKKQMFELCDAAIKGAWDFNKDMPQLDDVLKGV